MQNPLRWPLPRQREAEKAAQELHRLLKEGRE